MRVNCVDDRSVAIANSITITEDANITLIKVLANDTDVVVCA